MSYFDGPAKGYGWNAGHFLVDDETCLRKTMTIAATHAQAVTRDNGRKVVPAGAIIPSNDGNAKGILYEDIDVTEGAKVGSVVIEGTVYEDRLPAAIESAAESALLESPSSPPRPPSPAPTGTRRLGHRLPSRPQRVRQAARPLSASLASRSALARSFSTRPTPPCPPPRRLAAP